MAGSGGIAVVALVGLFAWGGATKQLPASLQKVYDGFVGSIGSGSPPGAKPPGASCSADAIATWSKGISLPTWVGTLYCADNGQLPSGPNGLTDLNNWGVSKGYKQGANWVPPAGSG